MNIIVEENEMNEENLLVELKICRPMDGINIPSYATWGSAGFDLHAVIESDIIIKSQERELIHTGIAIALPDGYEAQIRSRSGLALKNGIMVLNSPGTIDSDYRGEIMVILYNTGKEDFIVQRGMRIAQMVVQSYEKVQFDIVSHLSETIRNLDGFGSTGL